MKTPSAKNLAILYGIAFTTGLLAAKLYTDYRADKDLKAELKKPSRPAIHYIGYEQ